MKFTILLPHYKTGKMTAYCMHQLLKMKGKHDINIIVINNSTSEGREWQELWKKVLAPLQETMNPNNEVLVSEYPPELMQSHGIAFDWALTKFYDRISDYFITVESDSFPTQDNWLDYYENLINEGYDMAGSRLRLSGGEYIHPAGAMYKKSNWKEAKDFVGIMNKHYHYYPNLGMKDGFPCHIMSSYILEDFPDKHHSYNNVSFDKQLESYLPIATSVFHNGQGFKQESYLTYGQRTIASEQESIGMPPQYPDSYTYRMGYEPGQWFSYWHYARNKKVYQIGTEIVWMPNRVNQQQEYTQMDNGFRHLWGITAYGGGEKNEATADIYERKKQLMEELYNSIK